MQRIKVIKFSRDNLYYHSLIYIVKDEFDNKTFASSSVNYGSECVFYNKKIPYDKEIILIDGSNLRNSVEYVRDRCNYNNHGIIIIAPKVISRIIISCVEFNKNNIIWLDVHCAKEALVRSLKCNSFASKNKISKLLTLAEMKTVKYILCGYSNRSTAYFLNKNEKTISYIKKNAMRKMEINDFALPLKLTSSYEFKSLIDYALEV
jgi:DNA-binding CsgD family transcriptional regulator